MIPEVLKRLLQPWLKEIETDLLIDYIRQHSSDEETDVLKLEDDMSTVQLSEEEQIISPAFQMALVMTIVFNHSMFWKSMHFHETPPVEISGIPGETLPTGNRTGSGWNGKTVLASV